MKKRILLFAFALFAAFISFCQGIVKEKQVIKLKKYN
jgi:hypothetical protein